MNEPKRSSSILAYVGIAVAMSTTSAWAAPKATTTALTLSANSVASGTTVTLSTLVFSGAYPVSPGLVIFDDGQVVLGSAQLLSDGNATLKVRLGIGVHEIAAHFAGTGAYTKSSSTQQGLTVTGQFTTQTSINSSGNPGVYTLTGTVTTIGLMAPSGTIIFTDDTDAVTLGAAALGSSPAAQTFQPQVSYVEGASTYSLVAVDLNGDGVPDLASANLSFFAVRLGMGDGTFQRPQTTYTTGNDPVSIAAADFNGDGLMDLVVGT